MSKIKTAEEWFSEWIPPTEDGQTRKGWWSESYNEDAKLRFFWTKNDIIEFAQAYYDYRLKAELEAVIEELKSEMWEIPIEGREVFYNAGIEVAIEILKR